MAGLRTNNEDSWSSRNDECSALIFMAGPINWASSEGLGQKSDFDRYKG
jgi:hypothetical protein